MLSLLVFFGVLILSCASDFPLLDGRIVGGENADIKDYPYQLSLLYEGRHICGAALISQNWVVTAAHCADVPQTRSLSVRAGSTYRERGGQVLKVVKTYIHPKYSSAIVDFDVAAMELEENVTIDNARPVALPTLGTQVPIGALATVTGWGSIRQDGPLSDTLQVLRIPVITNEQCQAAYNFHTVTNRMFCAGFLGTGGRDSCQGDSGGPLVINGVLLGLVSWGFGCAKPEYPGVYSNVAVMSRFIRTVANI